MKSKTVLNMSILFIYLGVSYWQCVDKPNPPQLPPNKDLQITMSFQKYPMWCGHACVEMWVDYYCTSWIDQDTIAARFCDDTNPFTGMEVFQIANAINSYTRARLGVLLPSMNAKNKILSEVTVSLQDGNPTILMTQTPSGGNHAIIVKGYTKSALFPELYPILEDIHYNDPDVGERVRSYELFTSIDWLPIHGYLSETERDMGFYEFGYFYIVSAH